MPDLDRGNPGSERWREVPKITLWGLNLGLYLIYKTLDAPSGYTLFPFTTPKNQPQRPGGFLAVTCISTLLLAPPPSPYPSCELVSG